MHLRVAFPELLPRLEARGPRVDDVVGRLAAALTAVLHALNEKLRTCDDRYSDRFLERAAAPTGQGLRICVEAAEAPRPRGPSEASLDWHRFQPGALRYEVPLALDVAMPRHALAPTIEALGADDWTPAVTATDAGSGDDDASEWEGVATPSQSAASVVGGWAGGWRADTVREAPSMVPPERMPRVFDEPRALFTKTPPYVLQVTTERSERTLRREKIVVACSHYRTLEVLRDYLQRYMRLDVSTSNRVSAALRLCPSSSIAL